MTKFDPAGALVFSTYLGGSGPSVEARSIKAYVWGGSPPDGNAIEPSVIDNQIGTDGFGILVEDATGTSVRAGEMRRISASTPAAALPKA